MKEKRDFESLDPREQLTALWKMVHRLVLLIISILLINITIIPFLIPILIINTNSMTIINLRLAPLANLVSEVEEMCSESLNRLSSVEERGIPAKIAFAIIKISFLEFIFDYIDVHYAKLICLRSGTGTGTWRMKRGSW